MKTKLGLSAQKINKARELANQIVKPVQEYINKHTTITVERATLRLLGADGVNADGVPVPNIIAEQLKNKLSSGVARYFVSALIKTGKSVEDLNKAIAGGLDISKIEPADFVVVKKKALELVKCFGKKISSNVSFRNKKLEQFNTHACACFTSSYIFPVATIT